MIVAPEIIAKKYAAAFFNVYLHEINEEFLKKISLLKDFFSANRGFFIYFDNVSNKTKEKELALKKIVDHFGLSKGMQQLLELLIKHKRSGIVESTITYIHKSYLKIQNTLAFSVKTSHHLQKQEKKHIIDFIKHSIDVNTVQAEFFVQPKLICGVRVKGETFLWERSIHKLLNQIKINTLQQVEE